MVRIFSEFLKSLCVKKNLFCLLAVRALDFINLTLLYLAGSGVNRVQVVLSGFSVRFFCLCNFFYVGMVVCIPWLHPCLCV